MLKRVVLFSVLLVSAVFTADIVSQVNVKAIPDINGNYPAKAMVDKVQSVASTVLAKSPTDYPSFSGFPFVASYQMFSPKNGAIVTNMDTDSDLEIIYGTGTSLYVVNKDGSAVPGWPKIYDSYYEAVYSASFGDIDGDGQGEVVVTAGGALGGKIYAYKKDGTVCTGFPITTGKYPMIPVLADVDNDGKMEIILGNRTSQVYVYKGDGTVYPGWPKTMNKYIAAPCVVGDINNDGVKEVIAESSTRLYAWTKDGSLLPGFPYILPDTVQGSNSYSAPVLADLDKTGKKQIIFCSHSQDTANGSAIHVVNPDGTSHAGFPKTGFGSNWIYASPVVVDYDKDGYLDIIVSEYAASTDPIASLFGFKRDGSKLAGFPKGPTYGSANQPAIIDIDGDGKYEIVLDQNIQFGDYGEYIALKSDNTQPANWPVNVLKNTTFQQPVFTDLDNDGKLDMVCGGFQFDTPYAVYLYALKTGLAYDASKIVNPVYQYNVQHNGDLASNISVPVELSAFTAVSNGSAVNVKWQTATETNNAYFELYRNDVLVAKIDGKGTTTNTSAYSYNDKNLAVGSYSYKLIQHDFDGTSKTVGTVNVNVVTPSAFTLNQNYPNPFNPATVISYSLAKDSRVKLSVYNTLGQKVSELVNRNENAGFHQVTFDASKLSSGVYTYTIEAASGDASSSFIQSKKMIFAK